ncbi:MAG: hypothetical protein IJB80_00530 [Clostridia bacterium]|nr:hypothetical protein [Clostridia bacterium]
MEEKPIDLSGAVDMLKEMLSGEEGAQAIGQLMGMFQQGPPQEASPGMATGGIDGDSIAMMMQLQKAMAIMGQGQNNSRTQLLASLKPFLKPSRRDKVEQAMQLMKIGQVLAVMKDVQEG